jgi:triacylglycerol lipase
VPSSLRRPLVVAVVGVLLLVAAVVVGVRLASGDDEGRPVLLVYGYQGTTGQMEPLADALYAAGRNVTVVDLPDDNTGDLWASAWTLGQAADQAMADADADSVDVVAHSAGGIVTRLWVSTAGAEVAHRVVTLGSPHHGSDGAAVFDECLGACQQLTPGSDFLEELAEQDETPGVASWVSIWSADDGAVEPPESSELDGALNLRLQDICPGVQVDHSELLSDPLPLALAVAEVDADEPVEYGSDDCERLNGT